MEKTESGMRALEAGNRQAWDGALLSLATPHVLQSWAWGEFKSRHGWTATRLLFEEGGQVVAAASVLQRTVWRLPISILYLPKGPALDWNNADLAGRLLGELERLARHRRALFVKIDPDLYYPGAPATIPPRPACAPETVHLLRERGWHFSADQVQFRNTVLLDLDRTEDEILAGMQQKTRYNLRLAMRHGVTVRTGSAADLEMFYELYAETARRDGFVIRPQGYYRDAWGSFLESGSPGAPAPAARLLLAEVEGEAVAGLMLFLFGPVAWYMYGASSERHRQRMPNYLLQWEAIRQAQAAGCTLYDLWGAGEHAEESDPMWGVVRFKLGLGGRFTQGLGAWDYAPSRAAYWLYTVAMPRYLGRLRSRQQAPAAGL